MSDFDFIFDKDEAAETLSEKMEFNATMWKIGAITMERAAENGDIELNEMQRSCIAKAHTVAETISLERLELIADIDGRSLKSVRDTRDNMENIISNLEGECKGAAQAGELNATSMNDSAPSLQSRR